MGIPYQCAVITPVPQKVSALVSSKVVQPIMNAPTLAMMADTKIKCCVKLLARQPKSRKARQGGNSRAMSECDTLTTKLFYIPPLPLIMKIVSLVPVVVIIFII